MKRTIGLISTGIVMAFFASMANATVIASNRADDAAYDSGFSDGMIGGTGFGAWNITHGANSFSCTGNSRTNGFNNGRGINTPGGDSGRSWGLSSWGGDVTTASLPLSTPLLSGQTISFAFDYGFADSGGKAIAALQNDAAEDLMSISFTGGGNLDVNDNSGATNTGLGYSSDGFLATITLTSSTSFTGTITKRSDGSQAAISGTFLSPIGGQTVSRITFTDKNLGGSDSYKFYFNNIVIDDNTNAPVIVGNDNAADSVYGSGFSNGLNGGTGFGPWNLTTSSNSIAFTGNSRANGGGGGPGINTPGGDSGKAWGLGASNGETAAATRPFLTNMAPNQTITIDFDFAYVETGKSLGFALQNSSGENLMSVAFTGGGYLDVNDNNGATSTTLGWSSEGFEAQIKMDTSTTFSGTITKFTDDSQVAVSGTLLSPSGGQAISQIRFFANNIAPSGFSGDPGWWYYFNSIKITAPASPTPPSGVKDWYLLYQ